jgi:hypothetical protein
MPLVLSGDAGNRFSLSLPKRNVVVLLNGPKWKKIEKYFKVKSENFHFNDSLNYKNRYKIFYS